ncbi:hypothetical protein BpHYR1_042732 [Brachionus plicatilis]|uniref:Uncharacterized protein n=1 Tax=Brachionus plicatilis TaxID=10195 RepID=A0A3M7QYC7_BRAPC|nr:hypothetical protein BpHYR1_042732 [Brachionus plicatilis]
MPSLGRPLFKPSSKLHALHKFILDMSNRLQVLDERPGIASVRVRRIDTFGRKIVQLFKVYLNGLHLGIAPSFPVVIEVHLCKRPMSPLRMFMRTVSAKSSAL